MKKHSAVIIAIIVFLVVFIPFASSDPDGLERVVENFGVEEQPSFWQGLMPDYKIAAVEDAYVSTLLAGVIGVLLVLLVSLAVERAIAPKNQA
ncbi:MAG: PDGLE domain-containing protein [Candidatus Bathyarchaeota archaeon]|nr:PDGLE domain-containing protein [Candidatus Bathyarchaeota archaeon]